MTIRHLAPLALVLSAAPLASAQCVEEFIANAVLGGERFGYAIAVDGPFAAVGTPLGVGAGYGTGSVFMYERNGPDWQEVQRVFSTQVGLNGRFGQAVDLDGDVLVVGAPHHDAHVPDDGGAFVFERVGASWLFAAEFSSLGIGLSAHFGTAVAADGARVVVGAPNPPSAAGGSGAVWVFERGASGWAETQKLSAPAGVFQLGLSVALSGDRILAGTDSGQAIVYSLQGSNWAQTAVLVPGAPEYARYGHAVALQGDRALVGSPERSVPGAAFVHEFVAGTWYRRARLEARDGDFSNAGFGYSVALDGLRALVGAPFRHIVFYADMGTAYLFQERDEVWEHSYQYFDPSPTSAFSNFGWTVALQGSSMLVGVPNDTFHGGDSGSALALTLPNSAVTTCFCYDAPPCGNVAPMTGCANSTGAGALLAPCGSDSASLDDLVFTTTNLPSGQSALLFAGTDELELPFGDGRLCAGGMQVRVDFEIADTSGITVHGPGLAAQGAFEAGEVRHFQVWYRDPQGPCGSGFNTSNGLALRYAP